MSDLKHYQMYVNGEPTTFSSPREALDMGIATVFQDLATVPLMAPLMAPLIASDTRNRE